MFLIVKGFLPEKIFFTSLEESILYLPKGKAPKLSLP